MSISLNRDHGHPAPKISVKLTLTSVFVTSMNKCSNFDLKITDVITQNGLGLWSGIEMQPWLTTSLGTTRPRFIALHDESGTSLADYLIELANAQGWQCQYNEGDATPAMAAKRN